MVISLGNEFLTIELSVGNKNHQFIHDSPIVILDDLYELGQEQLRLKSDFPTIPERSVSESLYSGYILYECSNKTNDFGMIGKINLLKMKLIEDDFKNTDEFKKYCKAKINGDGECHPTESFISILELFEGRDIADMSNQEIRSLVTTELEKPEKA